MRGKKRGDPSEGGWTETEGTEQDKQDKRRRDERSLNEMRVFGMITAQTEESAASHLPSDKPSFVSPSTPESNFTSATLHLSLSLPLRGSLSLSVSLFHHLFPSPLSLSLSFTSLAPSFPWQTLHSSQHSTLLSHAFHRFSLSFHLLKNYSQSAGVNEGWRGTSAALEWAKLTD